jgi:hypothetical protein
MIKIDIHNEARDGCLTGGLIGGPANALRRFCSTCDMGCVRDVGLPLPACLNAMSHPLTCDQLKDKLWCFSRENGAVASDGLLFLPDGTVGGYQHKNEQYWHLEQGVLSFLNARRQPTVHFTQVAHLPDGLLRCQGVHLPDPSITLCLVERKERPRKNLTRLVFAKEIGPDDVAALLGRLAAAG